jgi:hypothetical protein
MTSLTTSDINEAVTTLRAGNCISLIANDAGWGDAELFEIIKCIAGGFGRNLITLKLDGNNFSMEALTVLCRIIGPTNVARARNNMLNNPNPQ